MIARAPITKAVFEEHDPARETRIQFSRFIRDHTPPGSIIVHTDRNMVSVYYSQRHVIRAVGGDSVFFTYRQSIFDLCDVCPVFAAIPNSKKADFTRMLTTYGEHAANDIGLIVRLR